MASSWLLLQLSDSAFPAGGFQHSSGLEAALQLGELADPRAHFVQWLEQLGRAGLPLVSEAHERPERLAALDERMEAFLGNHVLRRASRTQGRAFLDTCARIFGPRLEALRAPHGHHAPVFGAALRALEVGLEDAQRLYLSQGLRGLSSAAVRLNALGTHQAQALLAALAPELERVLHACAPLRAADLAQTAPLLDLFASAHDRLYSRLFLS